VTGRVLVTARCERRGCALAKVLATTTGPRIIIPKLAAGVRGKGSKVHTGRGSHFEEPFEPWMSYIATCNCKAAHLVDCSRLQRAIESGESRVIVEPTM
jgi:hypothetical protein